MSLTFYLESHKYEGRYMYLSCIQTPDILTNTSKIDWTFVSTGGSAEYYATGPTVVKINGQQVFYAEMMGWTARKFPTAKGSVSGSLTIPHNDDGTKSIEVLLSTAIYTEEVKEQKATWELNKIDRFAFIKSAPDFNDAENPTITYSNPAGTNISSLQACISLDGSKDDVAYRPLDENGSSYTFNLTEAERNVLRAATKESNSRTVVFFVRSSIGENVRRSTLNRTLSIVNANPTLSPTVVDTNIKTVGVTGDDKILVALHSTADVKLNAVAKKSATIVSRKIEHGNQVLTDDGTLSVTNNLIKFTVVDSRGNTTTADATNTIVPYFNPTCIIGNNLPEADGSFELEVTGLFYNGAIGKTTNALTVQYRVRKGYGEYGQWVTIRTVTTNENSYTAKESLTGLDYQTSYTFQVRVIDAINTDGIVSGEKKVIAEPVFHWGQNDFMFNVPVNLKTGCDIIKNGEVAYAPFGFGLGDSAGKVITTDCNEATKNGWYYVAGASNAASPYDHSMLVVGYGASAVHQIAFLGNAVSANVLIQIRKCYGSAWNEWEWPNPPMAVGVEYRTTERYEGAPVYTQLVDLGTTTASMSSTVSISGITRLIRAVPNLNNAVCTEWDGSSGANTNNKFYFCPEKNGSAGVAFYISCGSLRTGKNLKAQVWYTKN